MRTKPSFSSLPLPSSSSSFAPCPTSSVLCISSVGRGSSSAAGGSEGGVSETDIRRRGAVSSGRGCVTVTDMIGNGDPLRAASSRYKGCGDSSPRGGVVLTTRNWRRGGVCVLDRRSRSLLPVRGGGAIGDIFPELLGESCSTCTGVGWATGTGADTGAGTGTGWIGMG